MRRLEILALFVLLLLTLPATLLYGQGNLVTGSVRSGKKALSSVAVTDGYNIVLTDASGNYRIETDPRSRFVYISTPAGYMPPVENGLVKFYKPLDGSREYDFNLERKNEDDSRHGFIAIADPQVLKESEIGMMGQAVKDIASTVSAHPGYRFHGMGCGDIVFDKPHLYESYNSAMLPAGLPFYHSIGNHDMNYSNRSFESSYETYEDIFGPCWYSYNVGKIHYIVLNDTFYLGRDYHYIGYLDETQLQWLGQDLSHVPKGKTVVLTMHIPSTVSQADRDRFRWNDINNVLTNKKPLYDILDGYNAHIVSGHYHTTFNSEIRDNLYEHNIAALSGAWWQGPLCTDGTPAGYGVFLCDGDDVRWYYKSVGHPRDYQLKVYCEPAEDGQTEVVANVWNADSKWKVELFRDGESLGEMERFETVDPDALRMYSDKDKLDHKWINPTKSDHFFRKRITDASGTLEVVVTDRFGQVYRSEADSPESIEAIAAEFFYPAVSPQIRFTGRTHEENGSVSFDWSGTYFSFDCEAEALRLHFSDTGRNYYNLFVDGIFRDIITTSGEHACIDIPVGQPGQRKNIFFQKRSEGEQGVTTIHGVSVLSGFKIYRDTTARARHIEFIGDSLTCGFGTEGSSPQEPFKPETENCNLAFACITSRYFDADYTLIAHSGQGAVRNWDDSVQQSAVAMRHRYLRTFDENPHLLWDFGSSPYKPDVVVINLGSNDFSTSPVPNFDQFAEGYESIIQSVKKAYGEEIPVVCMTPRTDSSASEYIKTICRQSAYANLYFAPLAPEICNGSTDLGSVWHPNGTGHRKMAMALIPYICTATGWELVDKAVN